MKTTEVARYALRLNFGQISEIAQASAPDRTVSRSAAVLATVGIALSSFSLKQMLNSRQPVIRKI